VSTHSPLADVLRVDGQAVAVLEPGTDLPPEHSPRPYVHPIRTLSGVVVTDLAPADHPWHAGLSLAIADVDGDNYWGGNTFVAGQGYVLLDDHGRVEAGTPVERPSEGVCRFDAYWRDRRGRAVLRERRTLRAAATEVPGAWRLSADSDLTNLTEAVLGFGSPGTRGRPDAGYGGWTLRLAPLLIGAEVLTSESGGRPCGEDALGRAARWVCFRGSGVSVLVADHAALRGEPAPAWYVRVDEFPAVGPAPYFRDVVPLRPGATMSTGVTVVVSDGVLDPAAAVAAIA
jgi:hypothetical protein